jgi:putative ABC transport system substrate-binding protein
VNHASSYVDKILKGSRPGDLPVELPTKFELVIDMRTARALGVTIPQSVLLRADKVNETIISEQAPRIAGLALRHKLPAIFGTDRGVEAGGLMSYAPDRGDLYRRIAIMVDKIFKGAKPGDLPIEQPTKLELVINLKTAKALGITIQQSILLRAEKVIE